MVENEKRIIVSKTTKTQGVDGNIVEMRSDDGVIIMYQSVDGSIDNTFRHSAVDTHKHWAVRTFKA